MELAELYAHVKGLGIVPTLIALVYFHKAVRPALVEVRDFAVFVYALGYAWAKVNGVNLDAIRKEREGEVPPIPGVSSLLESGVELLSPRPPVKP